VVVVCRIEFARREFVHCVCVRVCECVLLLLLLVVLVVASVCYRCCFYRNGYQIFEVVAHSDLCLFGGCA